MRGQVKDDVKDARLLQEIDALSARLDEALASDVMRRASEPDFLPLGSPTLQRREGYREVLQAWLHFAMAARLVWHGGDKVYGAGQRGVATLYEYWVFFELLYIVAEGLHSLVIWSMTLCRTWNFLSTRATTLCCRANRQVLRLGTRLRHL